MWPTWCRHSVFSPCISPSLNSTKSWIPRLSSRCNQKTFQKKFSSDFPGGPVVKTASGTGLVPGQGRSHMPKGAAQTNKQKEMFFSSGQNTRKGPPCGIDLLGEDWYNLIFFTLLCRPQARGHTPMQTCFIIYLFIYFSGCARSSLLCRRFSSSDELGLLPSCGAGASHCSGVSRWGARTLEHTTFSSRGPSVAACLGSRAQVP